MSDLLEYIAWSTSGARYAGNPLLGLPYNEIGQDDINYWIEKRRIVKK